MSSEEYNAFERDQQWLIDNKHYNINPEKFCCRVTRFVVDDGWPEESARKEVVKLLNQEAAIELGIA